MKVKDLIKKLKRMDPDLNVYIDVYELGLRKIKEVKFKKCNLYYNSLKNKPYAKLSYED